MTFGVHRLTTCLRLVESQLKVRYGSTMATRGNVWEIEHTQPSVIFEAVHGFGPTSVIAVGSNGTILRYSEAPPLATAANFPFSVNASPFINARTGELILQETDFELGHVVPVAFTRYYASGLQTDTRVGGSLGRNWTPHLRVATDPR